MPNRFLMWAIAALLLGIASGFLVPALSLPVTLGVSAIGLAFVTLLPRSYAVFGVFVCMFALGLARDALVVPVTNPLLDSYLGQKVELGGIVDNEPDVRETAQHLQIRVTSIDTVPVPEQSQTDVLATLSKYKTIKYGDAVTFEGKLKLPESFEGDTGRTFDYVHYLAKDGIGYSMPYGDIAVVDHDKGNQFFAALINLKEWYVSGLENALPDKEAGLAGGITAGTKRAMGGDLLQDFRTAGVVHIVVLSGYNITLVSSSILFLLSKAPRMLGAFGGALSILAFVLATGGSASAVRSGIMACLGLLAFATHRTYDVLRALLITVCAMVLYNPMTLLYDPGFQLSAISTLGIMYVAPLFAKRLSWVTENFGIREILSATLGTQLAVLPLLLYQTGMLSIVALPVNLLIVPLVPLAMLLAFFAGVFGALVPSLAYVLGNPAHLILHSMLTIVQTAAHLPYAAVTTPAFSFWLVVLLYGVGAFVFMRFGLLQNALPQRSS